MLTEKLVFDYSIPKTLFIKLSGDWQISAGLLSVNEVTSQLASHPDISEIKFSVSEELKWDSGLISFLLKLIRECAHKNIQVVRQELPQEAQKLLVLALKVHEKNISSQDAPEPFFERFGEKVLQNIKGLHSGLDFLGDIAVSLGRLIRGKSYFR